ncbi:hypothetical protein BAUCODRAFT_35503, partial [Baudoinia panamericana UAMH 10762]
MASFGSADTSTVNDLDAAASDIGAYYHFHCRRHHSGFARTGDEVSAYRMLAH